jgi:hypothetical protein
MYSIGYFFALRVSTYVCIFLQFYLRILLSFLPQTAFTILILCITHDKSCIESKTNILAGVQKCRLRF